MSTKTKLHLKAERAQILRDARAIAEAAKAADRDLTPAEITRINSDIERVDQIDREMKGAADGIDWAQRVADMTAIKSPGVPGSGWATSVMSKMSDAAGSLGVKALLSGEVDTPPAVEVVQTPGRPTRLLDLINRAELNEHTFSYLRQTVRDEDVQAVADGATKPTSTYTFEEITDHARVIAHLSEPFPLRYLTDHDSMVTVLDGQMRTGVVREVERQIIDGDGTGENFTGLLNLAGTTAVPFDTDMLTTARKARTALENLDETPTAWVLNPSDAETLELQREDGATGGFLMGDGAYDVIFGEGVQRLWSRAVPAGTAILADWTQVRLRVRQTEHTLAATQAGDLFDKNQVKLRAEGRYALQVLRPQAIAIVDLNAAP